MIVAVAAWWLTFHNVHTDYITRCSDAEFGKIVAEKGWRVVDIQGTLKQAVEDSERFRPCLLAWSDDDRQAKSRCSERTEAASCNPLLGSSVLGYPEVRAVGWNGAVGARLHAGAHNVTGSAARRAASRQAQLVQSWLQVFEATSDGWS